MANTREIQSRIKSIKDTKKITNAMYMVSSSKLQKARRDLARTEPYFFMIQENLAKILKTAPDVGTDYFDQRPQRQGKDRRIGYLVITADKGLAGAYNHNIIKTATTRELSETNDMLFVVGQVGRHFFEKRNIPIDIHFNFTAQDPTMGRARHIAEELIDFFLDEKIDELYVVYTRMVNSMTVEPTVQKILPLRPEHIKTDGRAYDESVAFLPDAKTVFDYILPSYIAGFIYGALVESYCSEHNSRMLAMQTATDAATDMIRNLGIQFNRARQSAITQEITEVAAGSRAQKNHGKIIS